ncbi:carbamoyl-phosphate synthase large subunit [Candidatus Bipolaricaulota bacterium]|nr:carbamoyl-phosphate synthase large subunit [Candidatus Bipolaricaulota bacterium]
MPKRKDIEKILIIGAGPIVIGQAAEFDYSGTQALRALKKAGYKLVVVNSNSATIMTDPELSDAVYIEPLTAESLERVIERERPEALLPTLGGQTALNLAVELAESGVLERYGVELIGARLEAIRRAEDRELFKETVEGAGLEVLRSRTVGSLREALRAAEELGYPVIVRPSFTLGGTGGGVAYNAEELEGIVARGLLESPAHTVLIEESALGWKEYELEVMRDGAGNTVVVCSIENLDPMGVHTGDSITVAPAQTLTDREYQRMRDAAFAVLGAIGVETGGANVQFAVHPETGRMVVIEMNPRVSRSSALASKATGYPIAKVAALVAVGLRLDEIPNYITRRTTAAFEPAIDYVVVKVPRFQLEKFPGADPRLSTQMKSVGEVMAIGRTFKEALGKALRALELDATPRLDFRHLREYLANPTPERISYIFAALRQGIPLEEIHRLTGIDPWFLSQMEEFVRLEERLRRMGWEELGAETLRLAKAWGFSDRELSELFGRTEGEVRTRRRRLGIKPAFKMVDTCAAEFSAATPYFYSTYAGEENEALPSSRPKIVILGSGPNRIGQGIEFDYANVHAAWALQEEGYEVIMVNSNPETVSTDYDTSDRLYFEPLTVEDVLAVVENERPVGVVVGFGGQTPLKLARKLAQEGVPLLGMNLEPIELAESREHFARLLGELGLKSPPWGTATSPEEAIKVAEGLGYPVLLRPSYVLGGRAMQIVDSPEELRHYVAEATRVAPEHPLLVDRFLEGALELDVDLVTDGRHIWVAGLMEQIEEAGVHSGDSACVLPPISLSREMISRVEEAAALIAGALGAVGLVNIQLAIKGEEIYVLEANPRASRTVPFVSKAIGVPLAKLAAKVLVGRRLPDLLADFPQVQGEWRTVRGPRGPVWLLPSPRPCCYSVKEAVFPFGRFPGADVLLGPEMRSTGEVMGMGRDFPEAFAKAQLAAGSPLPASGKVLASLADRDKREGIPLLATLHDLGFRLLATEGTARALQALGIPAEPVAKVGEGRPDVVDLIAQGEVDLLVNTPSPARRPVPAPPLPPSAVERGVPLPLEDERTVGYRIRTEAARHHVPYITTLAALRAAVAAIRTRTRSPVLPLHELHQRRPGAPSPGTRTRRSSHLSDCDSTNTSTR